MTAGAVAVLGIGQCINWGVLYYAFAVLVLPLQRELGVDTWVVTGALSCALLMSAALAPAIGRWADRGHGPLVMQMGGMTATALLLVWPFLPGVAGLYVVWAGLGLCMAATLYEPAFVIVARAYQDPTRRLRAVAAITLFGGLASTAFLPGTALLITTMGWRVTALGLAIALGLSTVLVRELEFRRLAAGAPLESASGTRRRRRLEHGSAQFVTLAATFALTTLASGAFATNLVPALGERGLAPTSAALLGGLMGAMQLPGRALLMRGMFATSPVTLLVVSLACQAGGLGLVVLGPAAPLVALGALTFALGAGVATVVRPHLVQTMCGVESGGVCNGRIARQQQLARAASPIVVAWIASMFSYAVVFAVLAAAFLIAGFAAHGMLGEGRSPALNARPRS